jgi:hypothetical protein
LRYSAPQNQKEQPSSRCWHNSFDFQWFQAAGSRLSANGAIGSAFKIVMTICFFHFIDSGNLNMIKPVFVPLETLEAEEDNEPPSLHRGYHFLPDSIFHMDSPAFSLTTKPKFTRINSLFSGADIIRIIRQGLCFCISLSGSVGEVLTFFPWRPISGSPRC